VFGFLRGKVGGVSYSVAKSGTSKSGKTQQIVRALPESVKNPNTISQIMQRMKVRPAQRYYAALKELLSNAFQGVAYGEASRLYFLKLAMQQTGPYVPKGVARFIPAAYPFTRGSLPSIGVHAFAGGNTQVALDIAVEGESTQLTGSQVAALMGVSDETQLTVCVVNNVAGVFVPSYIPFEQRLKMKDVPNGTFIAQDGFVTIIPSNLGLDVSAMVAFAIAISIQDASGAWLRSEQDMVLSNELRNQLYSPEALEAALASYQSESGANSINSQWYYNLGLNQAFNGQLTTLTVNVNGTTVELLVGLQNIQGRIAYTVYASAIDDEEAKVVGVIGQTATYDLDNGQPVTVAEVRTALEARGITFSVAQITPAIIAQSGKDNGLTENNMLYYRMENNRGFLVDEKGAVIRTAIDDGYNPVIYDPVNQKYKIEDPGGTDPTDIWGVSSIVVPSSGTKVIGKYTFTAENSNVTITPAPTEYPS
jgi:hypothetical protein